MKEVDRPDAPLIEASTDQVAGAAPVRADELPDASLPVAPAATDAPSSDAIRVRPARPKDPTRPARAVTPSVAT
jgi:hypothetical protein